ncbi:MAG: exonuclease V [Candidatus Marsarchaeota archaeon]|nr:exonuclease V [Candidatus Marsarchaeota archaeon]
MSVLTMLNKKSIRVTDIASQYWCERQMELRYLYGDKKKTVEEKKGTLLHEMLENETNVPVLLEPKSYADYMYKTLYTSSIALSALKENGRTREVQVFGRMEGFNLVGKIDQLNFRNEVVTVEEDKTRANDNLPNASQMLPNKVQVMFYRSMLEDIQNGTYTLEDFKKAYYTERLVLTDEFRRQLAAMHIEQSKHSMQYVEKEFFSKVKSMGEIGDTLYIKYINQFTEDTIKIYKFQYSRAELEKSKEFVFKYWKGIRKALPVPKEEKWKCNYCVFFGKQCKVWWGQKTIS